jgi:hypothetical protein
MQRVIAETGLSPNNIEPDQLLRAITVFAKKTTTFVNDNTGAATLNTEINAAIQTLPAGGGKIVIREGVYNITDSIIINKDNVTIEGMGDSTVLKNCLVSDTAVIRIEANGVKIANLAIAGSSSVAQGNKCGIRCSANNCEISRVKCYGIGTGINISGNNNKLIGNDFNGNGVGNDGRGISLSNDGGNIVIGNKSTGNGGYNIQLVNSSSNVISSNDFCNSLSQGIHIVGTSNNNLIDGNSCFCGTGLTTDYTANQNTIVLGEGTNNLVVNNLLLGKNYFNGAGATNTFVNNKYN